MDGGVGILRFYFTLKFLKHQNSILKLAKFNIMENPEHRK